MISAFNHRSIGKGDVFRMRFPRPIDASQDLVLSVLDVCGTIRLVQYTDFEFYWSELIESPTVYANSVLIH